MYILIFWTGSAQKVLSVGDSKIPANKVKERECHRKLSLSQQGFCHLQHLDLFGRNQSKKSPCMYRTQKVPGAGNTRQSKSGPSTTTNNIDQHRQIWSAYWNSYEQEIWVETPEPTTTTFTDKSSINIEKKLVFANQFSKLLKSSEMVMGIATIHKFGIFISGLFDVQLPLKRTNKSRKLSMTFEIFDTSILAVHFVIPYQAK